MPNFDTLYKRLLDIRFTPEQARYSARKMIDCAERVDRKYSDDGKEITFFPLNESVS